jgi:hypothetical protein
MEMTPEARDFLTSREVEVILRTTPSAIEEFNLISGRKIGLFHITC